MFKIRKEKIKYKIREHKGSSTDTIKGTIILVFREQMREIYIKHPSVERFRL